MNDEDCGQVVYPVSVMYYLFRVAHTLIKTSVSDLAKQVAGHQGLQIQKVVGPDEKL